MYNNNEDNIFNKRTTTVLEEDRKTATIDSQSQSQSQSKPSIGFTPVTKNPNRLTVTNTGRQATEIGKVAKQKEKVATKNIAMMVVYSVVALALGAVIAINAISLGAISATNTQLSAQLATLETTYSTLSTELSAVSSADRMAELAASQLDLTATTASSASFSVPGYVTLETQTFTNNWFDNFLDNIG